MWAATKAVFRKKYMCSLNYIYLKVRKAGNYSVVST